MSTDDLPPPWLRLLEAQRGLEKAELKYWGRFYLCEGLALLAEVDPKTGHLHLNYKILVKAHLDEDQAVHFASWLMWVYRGDRFPAPGQERHSPDAKERRR